MEKMEYVINLCGALRLVLLSSLTFFTVIAILFLGWWNFLRGDKKEGGESNPVKNKEFNFWGISFKDAQFKHDPDMGALPH